MKIFPTYVRLGHELFTNLCPDIELNDSLSVRVLRLIFRGLLTGKIKRGVRPKEGRLGFVADNSKVFQQRSSGAYPDWQGFSDKDFDIVEAAEEIAKTKGGTWNNERLIHIVFEKWIQE